MSLISFSLFSEDFRQLFKTCLKKQQVALQLSCQKYGSKIYSKFQICAILSSPEIWFVSEKMISQ